MEKQNGTRQLWFLDTDGKYVRVLMRTAGERWTVQRVKETRARAIKLMRERGGNWNTTADRIERETLREFMLHPYGPTALVTSWVFTDSKGKELPRK